MREYVEINMGEELRTLEEAAQHLADSVDMNATEFQNMGQAMAHYLMSFGIDAESAREIARAIENMILYGENVATSMQKAFEELREYGEDARREADADRRDRPPKRVQALGLSPPQRKYWINYKPRNRLPAKGLKKANDRRAET